MAKSLNKNQKLFQRAKASLVGGVDSPVRSFSYVGGDPVLIKNGRGSKVYDYNGKAYIDYVLSWGALILGHVHPQVIKELKQAINLGLSFGTTNAREVELAELICQAIPFVNKVRFVNSGTEAVMGAVRLARGYTNRDKIIKFINAYHGHADYLLVKGGSGLATLNIPASAGVPKDFVKHTLLVPYGDAECLEKTFKRYGREIAAVLLEPVGGNYGVIVPDLMFLKKIKGLTVRNGSLLIFDEVITGFRFNFGSISGELGVKPDLICLGKIIGGGLPIGAYAGADKIMRKLAPLGNVYQASTFSGNPVVMSSGLATLKALALLKNRYQKLEELRKYLTDGLKTHARRRNIDFEIAVFGSMFSLKFNQKIEFQRFYRKMLDKGVYLSPSEFEANFLSFAHTQQDVDHTLAAAKSAL